MKIIKANIISVLAIAGWLATYTTASADGPAPGDLPPGKDQIALPQEYVAFVAAKEQQAKDIAREHGFELDAGYQEFFAAAKAGRAQEARLTGRRLRADTHDPANQTPLIQVQLEVVLAIEALAEGDPDLALGLGHEMMKSLPPGCIYFGGSDAGRGLPTMLCQSPGDPVFVITQNYLTDHRYLELLREEYGSRIRLPKPLEIRQIRNDYLADAVRRQKLNQLKPGETIRMVDGKPTPEGMVASIEISARTARFIFEQNPDREFFYQEGYPLDWLNPYLSPSGLLMKINRQPPPTLPADEVQASTDFWTAMIKSLSDNPQFAGDDYITKVYAHMRSCQADVYGWRAQTAQEAGEKQRMYEAARTAYEQALEIRPTLPNGVFGMVGLAANFGKIGDALPAVQTALKADPDNEQFKTLLKNVEQYQAQTGQTNGK